VEHRSLEWLSFAYTDNYLRARCSTERFGCGYAALSLCGFA
jgi:hypothetical protein